MKKWQKKVIFVGGMVLVLILGVVLVGIERWLFPDWTESTRNLIAICQGLVLGNLGMLALIEIADPFSW